MHTRFDYYQATHMCPPESISASKSTLAEALTQQHWQTSPYSVNMGEDKKCEFVCQYKVTQADMHKYELLSDKHFEYRL